MPTLPTAIQEIEQELEKTITMLHALSHIARRFPGIVCANNDSSDPQEIPLS